ncbi:MAG: Gfo/Idh/MocA family oxidoreductase [Phycisphaerae bacterium]
MATPQRSTSGQSVSRRKFLKGSAAAGAAAMTAGLAARVAYAAGSDVLKVGLIGCGGRANGAIRNNLEAAQIVGQKVQVVAFGDLWEDRAKGALHGVKRWADEHKMADAVTADEDHCFGGFDNYKKVIASGIDYIVTATPPGFRPYHFREAVAQGKHVFMEKPVCVDPWGYNEVCKTADEADKKKLTVVAGTQRRHRTRRQENLKRIHDGALGELTGGQCYWRGGPVTHNRKRKEGMSDIEWQIYNWFAWCWTCGDHIVEQHVHNIDMICWAFGTHPESAYGIGGRQDRPEPGNIYDHHAVEFAFPGGARVASYCSHFKNTTGRVSERVVGTKGESRLGGDYRLWDGNGWRFDGDDRNPYVQEHVDLFNSITGKGEHWNEGRQVAESCMAAVLGRMSNYTGRQIKWDWAVKESKLKLGPEGMHAFGPYEPPPVAIPGKTKLI